MDVFFLMFLSEFERDCVFGKQVYECVKSADI
jgi:hypothetical protein